MKIAAVAAVLTLLIVAPAGAADDPAVTACEGIALADRPQAGYRRISATIERHVVSIRYQLSTELKPRAARCDFKPDAEGRWAFNTANSAEAEACIAHSDQVIVMLRTGATTRARREQPRLQSCLKILETEQAFRLRALGVSTTLVLRNAYPIPADQTALRAH